MEDRKPITIKNFLSEDECKKILDTYLSKLKLEPALIDGGKLDNNLRKSSVAFIDTIDSIDNRLKNTLNQNIKIKDNTLTGLSRYQLTQYGVGEYYGWHIDSDNNKNKNRYCSIVIQLNNEYEGGDLEFKDVNGNEIKFERGVGNLHIFFSDILHRVTPITEGVRHSLVNWVSLENIQHLKENLVLANLTQKIFAWTPPKTASTSASFILPKLGFELYKQEGGFLKPYQMENLNHHHCIFCNGHEKLSFITTLRNPYNMVVSHFKVPTNKEQWTSEQFEQFLYSYLYEEIHDVQRFPCYDHTIRKPDYIIRVESMLDDYLKIPHVRHTEYYKSGELEKDCLIKKNSSDYTNFDWRSLYNQNIADMVYYNYAQVFELGGYDRNSWKK
jgi:PKHD-type hydroxylase